MKAVSMKQVARSISLIAEAGMVLDSHYIDADHDELERLRDRVNACAEELAKSFVGRKEAEVKT